MVRRIRAGAAAAVCGAIAWSPASDASTATRIELLGLRGAERAAVVDALPTGAMDYGSFAWVDGPVGAPQGPFAAPVWGEIGLRSRVIDDAFTLRIGGIEFDPVEAAPAWPVGWEPAQGAGDTGLRIVQFRGPARSEWLGAISAAGGEVVAHVPPHAFIVWLPEGASIDGAAGVRWSGAFAPACRVLAWDRSLGSAPVRVQALVVRAAGVDATIGAVRTIGATEVRTAVLDARFASAVFTIAGDRLRDIATIEGIYAAQPLRPDAGSRGEFSALVAASEVVGAVPTPGYFGMLAGFGVDGDGVVIGHVDQGFADAHVDLAGAVVPCGGTTCAGAMSSTHGTIVAGLIAADASSNLKLSGFFRGLGVAPGCSLVEQTWVGNFNQPNGMLTLMKESWLNGASGSNNSWGTTGIAQGYDIATKLVDTGVRDADATVPGDQPLTYVVAVANGNGGVSSMGAPEEAKNVISVGSTFCQATGGAPNTFLDDISPGSAHGPALDGRMLPMLVAPGCFVDSTSMPTLHAFGCGTSFAAPHVTGVVALFIEQYRGLFPAAGDPSPALVKAVLCVGALDLAGKTDADGVLLGHAPDSKQGWGRVCTSRALDLATTALIDQSHIFTASGQEWEIAVSPIDDAEPVRIMLVWTDAPGHGLGGATPAWNNDLDLVVEVDGSLSFGNDFDPDGLSLPDGEPDPMNNTEAVVFDPAPAGAFTIIVRAANITSDGVPNVAGELDQDFALVVINGEVAGAACPGDLTGDGAVNSQDLNVLLAAFGATASGDLDGDGDTDSADLNILLAAFGDDCG